MKINADDEEMKLSGIYQILCLENGKKYIGKTHSPKAREKINKAAKLRHAKNRKAKMGES